MSHFMSGGYNGGTQKGKPDTAPQIRASFLIVIKIIEERKGKTFSELMIDWLDKDPIAMLNVISKFLPREARTRAGHDRTLTTAPLPATCAFVESVVDHKSAKGRVLAVHRPYGRRWFRRDFPRGANPHIGSLDQGTGSALMINYS